MKATTIKVEGQLLERLERQEQLAVAAERPPEISRLRAKLPVSGLRDSSSEEIVVYLGH